MYFSLRFMDFFERNMYFSERINNGKLSLFCMLSFNSPQRHGGTEGSFGGSKRRVITRERRKSFGSNRLSLAPPFLFPLLKPLSVPPRLCGERKSALTFGR